MLGEEGLYTLISRGEKQQEQFLGGEEIKRKIMVRRMAGSIPKVTYRKTNRASGKVKRPYTAPDTAIFTSKLV